MKRMIPMLIAFGIIITLILPIGALAAQSPKERYEIGMAYYYGDGVEQDYEHAFSYFMIAGEVEQYPPALNMLGICYRDGKGAEQNIDEALACFQRAAELGSSDATKNLEDLQTSLENDNYALPVTSAPQCKVGDIVIFGTYEQDNNLNNGAEPIEWKILNKKGGKVLLISEYALDARLFNTDWRDISWEKCTLRTWLNNDFYNSAFSAEERDQVLKTTVSADKSLEYSAASGKSTEDNVFLLSTAEAEKYFTTGEARMCIPTEYAIAQGVYTSSSNTLGGKVTCWWWLRSPASRQGYVACVNYAGAVYNYGYSVFNALGCVRPALWIDLKNKQREEKNIKKIDFTYSSSSIDCGKIAGHEGDAGIRNLKEIVENCISLNYQLEISNLSKGNVFGEWGFYIRDLEGNWQLTNTFNVNNLSISEEITFDVPVSFDAFAVHCHCLGDDWSFSYSELLTDAMIAEAE